MTDKGASILVGRTLNEVNVAADKKALRFRTDEGDVIALADGDCCSETWVEHMELPTLPAKVLAVEDIPMPDPPKDNERDVVAAYGFKVTTDKGHLIIEYRNESNGYYGGNLSWPKEYFYGGVHGQNVSEESWAVSEVAARD